MESITDLEREIRDLINKPRKKQSLLSDSARWNQLCSSMDVIGDTELAIVNYLENIEKPSSPGELYILLYGILQVLFVQQDAVKHLAEALNITFESTTKLTAIREARNDSTGHPTKREQGKGHKKELRFNFITRVSMSRGGFTLMTTHSSKNATFKQVDLIQLIREQRDELRNILSDVISALKKESMEHKSKYKDEKLADIFPPALHYYYEKITEIIFSNRRLEFGSGVLEIIESVVRKFRATLEARGIYQAYDLNDDFEFTEYPLSKLRQFLEGTDKGSINEKDSYIYLWFVQKQLDKLKQIAIEIDEDYETIEK